MLCAIIVLKLDKGVNLTQYNLIEYVYSLCALGASSPNELQPILEATSLEQLFDRCLKFFNHDSNIENFYGEKGLQNTMNIKHKTLGRSGLQRSVTEYEYKDPSHPFFDEDLLSNYSSKLSSILSLIKSEIL